MATVLTQMMDLGLQSLTPNNLLDLRSAARGSQNVLYEYGLVRTPDGYAKLDLSSALNSGDKVLHVFGYTEADRTKHHIAVTTEKIYRHDMLNNEWDAINGSTMLSNILHPISFAEVAHDDTDIYIDDDVTKAHAYFHLVVCDGGLSNIQRWAGKYESTTHNLVGGGGYHDGTTHRALQVGTFMSRLILISPLSYESSSKTWIANKQRIQWPQTAKLQSWNITSTGAGFADLADTGDENVWSALLGNQYIVYQKHSIWVLNYVGGTTVFDPKPVIPDLGLLSYHLLCSYNNAHYFVGNDYNVYVYYGGSIKQSIGDAIQSYLKADLDPASTHKCWLTMGKDGKWLWIYIVPEGETYITKAYGRNMISGAWTVKDLKHKYTTTTSGITCANLLPSEEYETGDTYSSFLNTIGIYDQSDAGDSTKRYGECLMDTSRVLTKDYTIGSWKAGGFDYSKAGGVFTADITTNDMMVVFDGSNATNVRWGHHFYTVYDVSANGFSVYPCQDVSTQGEHGIADSSTSLPLDLSVNVKKTIGFYSVCSFDDPGETYAESIIILQVAERMVLGDSDGWIYQFDSTSTQDDGVNRDSRHLTPIADLAMPDVYKRWEKMSCYAKEKISGNGGLKLRWRIANFDTSNTGWTDTTFDLTANWSKCEVFINRSSPSIQFAMLNCGSSDFEAEQFQFSYDLGENR